MRHNPNIGTARGRTCAFIIGAMTGSARFASAKLTSPRAKLPRNSGMILTSNR
jgi:hypothetical protein